MQTSGLSVGSGADTEKGMDISTKGSIHTSNGTTNTALAVGDDGFILSANSTEATGLEWISLPVTAGSSSGTINLQAATTAIDTDFADIVVAAGTLQTGSRIRIAIEGQQNAQNIYAVLSFHGTTSNPDSTPRIAVSGGIRQIHFIEVMQDATDTSLLTISCYNSNTGTLDFATNETIDTGTDNVLAAGFTLRISVYNSAASNARVVAYNMGWWK